MKARTKPIDEPLSSTIKNILIVDDHDLVCHGLSELLEGEADMHVVGTAGESTTAIDMVRQHKPDLVIIDIPLKDGSGLELITNIKALDEDVKMIVSSMHDEKIYAEHALRVGAMGYVSKEEPADTLIRPSAMCSKAAPS